MNSAGHDPTRNVVTALTAAGIGAIAVVRICGPRTRRFLDEHFSGRVEPMRCVHGTLRDGERVIDDPVVALSAEWMSADVNLHGGAWVVHECLELARRAGFEVTPEPIHDVGLSQVEREMVDALPLATTELALRVLLNQPQSWRDVGDDLSRVERGEALWWLLHPPRVAIVGAPNVGKSTLANQLFAQQRSITADVPGTTRDWVGEIANLDGLNVMLVDTPGVRDTRDPIEREAIDRSREIVGAADLVLVVLDATRPLEQTLLLRSPDALAVLNKTDLPRTIERVPAGAFEVVATRGRGVDELRRAIRRRFDCDEIDPTRPRWWTQRQRDAIRAASSINSRGTPMSPM